MTFRVLQVYAEDIELRLYDVVEVVGVYEYVPELAALDFGGMTLEEPEQFMLLPPLLAQERIPGPVSCETNLLSSCRHTISLFA